MFEWFSPFRDLMNEQEQKAGPNRAQRRAAEQEKRRQQRRGQRAYERSQRGKS